MSLAHLSPTVDDAPAQDASPEPDYKLVKAPFGKIPFNHLRLPVGRSGSLDHDPQLIKHSNELKVERVIGVYILHLRT